MTDRKERPSATPTPAPAGEQGQPKRAQTNPNRNPKSDDKPQLKGYCNSGPQHIKGLTNQTGYVTGNATGAINFGTLTASDATHSSTSTPPPTQPDPGLQQKREAFEMLADTLNKIDDGENDSATSQPSLSHRPASG